jgi:hypothetical protein
LALTLIAPIDSTDWVAVTPDGAFDGTAGGWARLKWNLGNDQPLLPLDAFLLDFYEPNLIAEVLGGNSPKPRKVLVGIDRTVPAVALMLGPSEHLVS